MLISLHLNTQQIGCILIRFLNKAISSFKLDYVDTEKEDTYREGFSGG